MRTEGAVGTDMEAGEEEVEDIGKREVIEREDTIDLETITTTAIIEAAAIAETAEKGEDDCSLLLPP